MKLLLIVLAVVVSHVAYGQVEVTAENLRDHVGDSVKYCGTVVSARLMDRINNTPAFLNIDGAYPNQVFTAVVWKQARARFTEAPEKFYLNKQVCIYGRVDRFRDQLQIVLHSENQIVVQQ